jgi:phage baseplate assembly protein W
MGRELYMRDKTDPNYKSEILEVNDDMEMLIQQIKMILMTNQGEVLGAPDFGMSLEELLYTMNVNEFSLRSQLQDHLMKFCPLAAKYNVNFQIKFVQGTVRDICLIDIFINGNNMFGVYVK